jgi:hypothetical protein
MPDPRVLADVALQMIAQAPVKADQQSLVAALNARQLLEGIKSGQLVVIQPPADKSPEATPEAEPARGAQVPRRFDQPTDADAA